MPAHKILVACDFSEPSARALGWGQTLADLQGSELHVVHVHPEIYDGRADVAAALPGASGDQLERYLRFLRSELERTLGEVAPARVERAHYHVSRGEPAHRLLALVEELRPDLVCVGTHGKTVLERTRLGSVSHRLLATSPVPVLVVP